LEFLAIDITTGTNIEAVASFKQTNAYTFTSGITHPSTLQSYEIASQATKIGIDKKGLIVFREGYGLLSETEWLNLFDMLTAPEPH
jgi:hypothetical protein